VLFESSVFDPIFAHLQQSTLNSEQ